MARIRVRVDGPLLIEGDDVSLCDANGAEFSLERHPFALCRCGESANKPFCDGSHRSSGFRDASEAGG